MHRKTNCTVSAIVCIYQIKPGLAVTQKNGFEGIIRIVQFFVKKSEKWQKPATQKVRKGKHRYL